MSKSKDPYPITDVYLLEMNAVDAAAVTVGDLCENLTNDFKTGSDAFEINELIKDLSKENALKKNSITFSNGADGGYSVFVGVDSKNKIRKILADANYAEYANYKEGTQTYNSFYSDLEDFNNQFFNEQNKTNCKRIKLFDLKTNSGLISVGDYGGHLRLLLGDGEYFKKGEIEDHIDKKYFQKNGIFQSNTPFFIVKFDYGLITKSEQSSFASSVIHEQNTEHLENVNYSYTELFSNLLDENCYPTKYIFEDYFLKVDEDGYDVDINFNSEFNLKINKDKKLSGNYLSSRLPKALQILKRQTKILFKENFKEVFEKRKKQFEDFIIGIIKDIEPQELDLPTFNQKPKKKKLSNKKLEISFTKGVAKLFDGYQFKKDVGFNLTDIIFPVKKGSYPVYYHCYSREDEGEEYARVLINIEGINGCYLNKDKKGRLIVNPNFKESLHIKNAIDQKLKSIKVDKIDLRNSKSLKEIEKLKNLENLTLTNIKFLKDWSPLSKLKKLKYLQLDGCIVDYNSSKSFFENLYKLPNLEKFSIDLDSFLREPFDDLPKNLYPKKLKEFELLIPQDIKDEKPSHEFEDYHGYAGKDDDQYYMRRILQIHNFPNFEKIKTLEKVNYYNFFHKNYKEGNVINNLSSNYFESSQFKNMKKLKTIWIYGYNFKKAEELKGTQFLEIAKKITNYNKVTINGISHKTLNKL